MYIKLCVLLFSISKCLKQSQNTLTKPHSVLWVCLFSPILWYTNIDALASAHSFFISLFLFPSRPPIVIFFFRRHVDLVFVLNTQNFTFQICSHDQKCNGILLTVFWFLLEIMQYCFSFFSRLVDRSVDHYLFGWNLQLNRVLCATIHLGQSCCVLYACTNNRQQQPTDLASSHCYFVYAISSLAQSTLELLISLSLAHFVLLCVADLDSRSQHIYIHLIIILFSFHFYQLKKSSWRTNNILSECVLSSDHRRYYYCHCHSHSNEIKTEHAKNTEKWKKKQNKFYRCIRYGTHTHTHS